MVAGQVPDGKADSALPALLDRPAQLAASPPAGTGEVAVTVIATTFAGVVAKWSPSAQSLFGWTASEALGRPLLELAEWSLSGDDFAEFIFVAGHGAWTRDVEVRNRFGIRRCLRMTATLAVGPDGEDEVITALRPGELPAAGARPPFRLVSERGSDLVLLCDREMVLVYAGPSLHAAFGYHGREVLGTRGWHYVHPDDGPRLHRQWQAAVSSPGEHRQLELRIRDAAGRWRWVQLRISNLLEDVAVSAMVLNVRDVTDSRRMAERLQASERLLEEILDVATEGVWLLDPEGHTVLANARMAELLAVDETRLATGSVYDFVDEVTAEFIQQRLRHRAAGVREQYELSLVRKDGLRRWWHVSALPRYDRSGSYIGSIGMCSDITDRKLLEHELERRGWAAAGPLDAADRGEEPGQDRSVLGHQHGEPAATQEPVPGLDRLSRREFEVVRMLLHGDRVPVIARQLFVSQSTVRNHLSSVFRKLRVRSQQELIVLLRERRLTD